MSQANHLMLQKLAVQGSLVIVQYENKYAVAKNHFDELTSSGFQLASLLPSLFLMIYELKRVRVKLVKVMKETRKEFKDEQDYSEYKRIMLLLDEIKPKLEQISSFTGSDVLPINYFITNMKKLSSTLLTFHGWAEGRVEYLNTSKFSTENTSFQFKSEKVLWESRNKAYTYWM